MICTPDLDVVKDVADYLREFHKAYLRSWAKEVDLKVELSAALINPANRGFRYFYASDNYTLCKARSLTMKEVMKTAKKIENGDFDIDLEKLSSDVHDSHTSFAFFMTCVMLAHWRR